MDKFWEWMQKKGYGKKLSEEKCVIFSEEHKYGRSPSKRMLIGFMFDYIKCHQPRAGTIHQLYKELENEIEEISSNEYY